MVHEEYSSNLHPHEHNSSYFCCADTTLLVIRVCMGGRGCGGGEIFVGASHSLKKQN